ncbi:alpha/beta fold hydrolase [Fodinicola acaciae]|uniref:alpha/beta fold hydrolase n=1 Tax=Fodinicola acaciae TaxID=2681555 RepID=UPI0013D36FAE|nr:alpha/beta hydrolase [Fodinicola acaciae]
MSINRRNLLSIGAAVTGAAVVGGPAAASASAASLPAGFRSAYAKVNGARLHYVAGGQGQPLVLLPGWPQTWWEYRKVMPALAQRYRVIVAELRGMGGSDKPAAGYDKKNMAKDIYELIRQLGYSSAHVAGHDIGSMVAFSFAVNHPDATRSVTLMDVSHPDEGLFRIPMLTPPGQPFNLWWFAFNQVQGLPEQLLAGRFRYLVDWTFDNLLENRAAVNDRDRAIYAAAYDHPEAIRAGNAWYKAFNQDIADGKTYGKIAAPLLGLASPMNYDYFSADLPTRGVNVKVEKIDNTGHFLVEEQPAAVVSALSAFVG